MRRSGFTWHNQKVKGERLKDKVGRLWKGFRKLGELPWNEQMLFSEAWFMHLTTGLILKVIPFRWIPRFFASPKSKVQSPKSQVIELIRNAIQRAGKVSPWRNRCLVSSLAGRCMLRRRKIESQISLGMAKDNEGRTVAHAWIKSGDVELVERSGDYTVLYTF